MHPAASGAQQEIAVRGRAQFARLSPGSDAVDDVAAMRDGRRREEFARRDAWIVEPPGDLVEPRSGRPVVDGAAHREIRIVRLDDAGQSLEMVRRPHVVVPEVGDVRSARQADALVVRGRLPARVPREVRPAHRVAEMRCENVAGGVRAAVAHDDDLVGAAGLTQRGFDRGDDPRGGVVRGDHDGEARHGSLPATADRPRAARP